MSRLIRVPPPLVYAVAFLTGLCIDTAFPVRLDWMHSFHWISWPLIIVGTVLGPLSAVSFLLQRTTLNPASRPSKLVTGGTYRISRNPMYLGLALIYVGLAILVDSLWVLILLIIPLLVMNAVVIPFEEAQSREVFGADYLAYCNRVRRWV